MLYLDRKKYSHDSKHMEAWIVDWLILFLFFDIKLPALQNNSSLGTLVTRDSYRYVKYRYYTGIFRLYLRLERNTGITLIPVFRHYSYTETDIIPKPILYRKK